MKQKIEDALRTEFKELGLSDKSIGRIADYIVDKGSVTKAEEIDAAVKGADVKAIAKSIQGEIDGLQKAKKKAEDDLSDYKAKHPAQKPDKPDDDDDDKGDDDKQKPDFAKAIADAVAAAVAPLTEKITALETVNSTKAALAGARDTFFGGDYAKKWKDEAADAWDRAVEINEATGNKMTAEELAAKAQTYFDKAVSRKGVDTSKPFQADPPADDAEGTTDWSGEKKRLQDEGKLPKPEN
jgi:hypothetical protein